MFGKCLKIRPDAGFIRKEGKVAFLNKPTLMKLIRLTLALVLLVICRAAIALPDGFYLPDSIKEMTLRYRSVENLIVLPVLINDRVVVNLILDTGCRNLVLFGKKFKSLLDLEKNKTIQFSGLGNGKPVVGGISLHNKISIHQVLGERIPVVVVPSRNVLVPYRDIDGVIGYDIFFKFEIQLNPAEKTITFRPAHRAEQPEGFASVPLRIVDQRPVMDSEVTIEGNEALKYEMMIDTGSSLGLLVKTTNIHRFLRGIKKTIGFGFNGPVTGYQMLSEVVSLDGMNLMNLQAGVIQSPWHNYASIGMDVLKNYVVVINYFKLYACFKPVA